MFKKVIIFFLIMAFILTFSSGVFAEDLPIVNILKNSLYGGVIGSILGSAVLAFSDKPSDHLNFIARGAAIGVFAGTVYGIYDASLFYYYMSDDAEYEGLYRPDLRIETGHIRTKDDHKEVVYLINLFRYDF